MSVEAIAAIAAPAPGVLAAPPPATDSVATPGLFQWFEKQVGEVESAIRTADQGVRELVVGDAQDLHRVMMDIEKARLSLDLVVQVRNRVVEAYQEVLRMQI